GVEVGEGRGSGRMKGDWGVQKEAFDDPTRRLPGIDSHFTARSRAVTVLGADGGLLDADRPDAAAAAEKRTEAVDGVEEVSAVPLHHRQQEIAASVATKPRVLERRQPREQHSPRLARIAR